MKCVVLALLGWGVVWKLGMESFICLLDDSKHPSGHSQVDCDKTNPSAHLSLDSNFAWALEGDSVLRIGLAEESKENPNPPAFYLHCL